MSTHSFGKPTALAAALAMTLAVSAVATAQDHLDEPHTHQQLHQPDNPEPEVSHNNAMKPHEHGGTADADNQDSAASQTGNRDAMDTGGESKSMSGTPAPYNASKYRDAAGNHQMAVSQDQALDQMDEGGHNHQTAEAKQDGAASKQNASDTQQQPTEAHEHGAADHDHAAIAQAQQAGDPQDDNATADEAVTGHEHDAGAGDHAEHASAEQPQETADNDQAAMQHQHGAERHDHASKEHDHTAHNHHYMSDDDGALQGSAAASPAALKNGDANSGDNKEENRASYALKTTHKVSVDNCWIRLMPPEGPSSMYFEIKNDSDKDVALTAVEAYGFSHAMLHRSIRDKEGNATMAGVESVEIAKNGAVEFKPGSYHVMLMKPASDLKTGEAVKVTFQLSSHETFDGSCEVKSAKAQSYDDK